MTGASHATGGGSVDMKAMAREERRELAAFLATLTPQQWDTPSLCAGWRVRDVVAHMISYDELTGRDLLVRLARGAFLLGRANAVGVAAAGDRTPGQLLATLTGHLEPRGLTAGFGGMIALVDGLIHHQDIRRALDAVRTIPEDRLVTTLRHAKRALAIGAFWRARGLRLVATDVPFTTGKGPEVRGPGEAILLAVAGRRGVVGELAGPGQSTLARRIGD